MVLQRVAEDVVDERDWRTRAPLSASEPARPPQQAAQQGAPTTAAAAAPTAGVPAKAGAPAAGPAAAAPAAAGAGAAPRVETSRIQTAAELGREAYRPGTALSGHERTLRTVKGILNKLTPEKFQRLLDQLLQVGIVLPEYVGLSGVGGDSACLGGWVVGRLREGSAAQHSAVLLFRKASF